ncbi:MAG TPA: BatD family protein [Vicinamibacteria bacterium]
MRRLRFSAALACLAVPAIASAAPKPFAWTNVHPRSVTVGQPVTLTVDVYVPSFFTGAPRFPQLEVKDAVVVFIDEGTNLNQRVGQQDYAGQRRSYKIYPQREGEFVVPDFAVKVSYTGEDGPVRVPAPAKGGAFQATIPAGARGVDHFLATSSLELLADTDRPLAGLRAGDAFTRTITMTAADAFAMMLPPLAFAPVDGLAVYPAQPKVADTSAGERGEARVAERRESVTYVLQKPGSYRVPATEIAWWDTRAQTLRRATLPELEFAVAAGPEAQAEIPLPEDPGQPKAAPDSWRPLREALRRFGPAALVALVAAGVILRLLRAPLQALGARRTARRRAREEAPAAYLARVAEAARTGRPKELLAATYRWLDRRPRTAAEAARLDRFVHQSGDAELPEVSAALVDAALEAEEVSDVESSERFARALARAAERTAPAAAPAPGSLGPLNPS